jgi:lipoate-protein ligase A
MNVLKCVNLRGLNIRDVLVLEEVLFRKSKENWFLYYYECPKAVVVGFSGKIKELINVEDASKQKVQIIRRYTGGGTVIIDENTVFTTFIMNVSCNTMK